MTRRSLLSALVGVSLACVAVMVLEVGVRAYEGWAMPSARAATASPLSPYGSSAKLASTIAGSAG